MSQLTARVLLDYSNLFGFGSILLVLGQLLLAQRFPMRVDRVSLRHDVLLRQTRTRNGRIEPAPSRFAPRAEPQPAREGDHDSAKNVRRCYKRFKALIYASATAMTPKTPAPVPLEGVLPSTMLADGCGS